MITTKIKKWGDSLVIVIPAEYADINKFKADEIVEVQINKKQKGGKNE